MSNQAHHDAVSLDMDPAPEEGGGSAKKQRRGKLQRSLAQVTKYSLMSSDMCLVNIALCCMTLVYKMLHHTSI